LFEAQGNKHTAVEQLKRTLKELRMSRPDLVNQMMEQLMQSRWGQYMDQSQLSLQQEELNMQKAAQKAANKRANAYASRSAYSPYSSYSSGSSGGSSGGTATGDGTSASGDGTAGSGDANAIFNQLILQNMGKKPPKPKPGKKK